MDYYKKIHGYLERAFASAPDTDKVRETKAELDADLVDKYNALLAEGHSPESAYQSTIGSIGDIFELVDNLTEDDGAAEARPAPASPVGKSMPYLWRAVPFAPMVMAGALLLFLLLDLFVSPGPRSVLRGVPYLLIGLGAVFFIVYLWMTRQKRAQPVGDGIRAKWYPVFVYILWGVSILACLLLSGTPHLRRLPYIILIITLAVQGLVNSVVIYAEGAEQHEKGNR